MKASLVLIAVVSLSFIACNRSKAPSSEKEAPLSFELQHAYKGDTVNLTDANGMRQGKWIPMPTNELTTTVIYKNDSIIEVLDTMSHGSSN